MLTVLYGVLAIILLIALEAATLFVYFLLRKKFAHRKILNEIIIMAFAVLCSLAVRFVVVIAMDAEEGVLGGMATGLYVLYSMFGGFSFEGSFALSEMAESVKTLWQCLYYGAAAYAGITFLMVASVRLSYEWYSYICICFRRLFKGYDRRYIFTDVSDESLLVAKDIKKKEDGRDGSYVIIFTGNELEPFDRKDPNHREVMDNGFYYYSYDKRSDKKKEPSLLKKFHYSESSVKKHDKTILTHNKLIHIFTLRGDENLRGAENKNSDIIFDDIRSALRDYCTQKDGIKGVYIPTPINYYLLTHRDINHEFYKNEVNKIIEEFLKDRGICPNEAKNKDKIINEISKSFQLHLINEAQLTACDMIREVQKSAFAGAATREEQEAAYGLYRGYMGMDADVYRAAVFGFGKTGQYALKELFINTARLKSDGKSPVQFIADVYDGDIDRFSGEFAYSHPLFFCRSGTDDKAPLSDEELMKWANEVKGDALEELCWGRDKYDKNKAGEKKLDASAEKDARKLFKEKIKNKSFYEPLKQKVFDEMGFPIVNFRAVSCFKKDFMSSIDDTIGIDHSNVNYRSYIICMGVDENNLTLANLLIDDFKHEILLKGDDYGQKCKTIFVHIRDEKNTARVNWTQEDKARFADKLAVVCFGCREDVWSYAEVLEDDFNARFHHVYQKVSSTPKAKYESEEAARDKIRGWIEGADKEDLNKESNYKNEWLAVESFLKESNASVRRFALNYKFDDKSIENDKNYYCRLEHLRWNRFYMSNGWIYADYDKEAKTEEEKKAAKAEKNFRRHNKEHTCLCPFEIMKGDDIKYDFCNVEIGKAVKLADLLLN